MPIRASSVSSVMYHTDRGERRYRLTLERGGEVWRFYQVVRDGGGARRRSSRDRRCRGRGRVTHR